MQKRTTQSIVSGAGVLAQIPAELSRFWPRQQALLVADKQTWDAAGTAVQAVCAAAGYAIAEPYVFTLPSGQRLHGDSERIAELRAVMAEHLRSGLVVPVAIGSGTVNDIVKRAAYELSLGYLCVPTAPSVDGYTSFGASITVKGFKTTLPCSAPLVVAADQDVMARAPYELLAAGYGDLAAKLTSGRDWLIAEALGLETIDKGIWRLSQEKLLERLGSPDKLALRDPAVVRGIFDGLCDTGLAMQDKGDSRPASGAEHHISHCWEMRGLQVHGVDVLHGEKVAAGTLLSAAVAEYLFAFSASEVAALASRAPELSRAERAKQVRGIFAGTGIQPSAIDEIVAVATEKMVMGAAREALLMKICFSWDELKQCTTLGRPSLSELRSLFSRAGCPDFSALGITPYLARWGVVAAQTIRNRYTAFDLAFDLGVLDLAADAVAAAVVG